MKKMIFLALAFLLVLVGCPQTPTTTTTTMQESDDIISFSATTKSIQSEYIQGEEELDLTGSTFLITFFDESGKKTKKIYKYVDIKDDITFDSIKTLNAGLQTIKCYYKKNHKFDVTITIIKARPKKNSWEINDIPSNYEIDHDFWDNATVYFALTDRFYNGNPLNDTSYGRDKGVYNKDPGDFWGGDIAGLTAKLDYIKSTGANAIWLTAPYEQIHGYVTGDTFKHYSYHGYYAIDWTQMDAAMGTVEEFRTFVDAAHEKGIRVILDVVMNHPGYATVQDMYYLFPGALSTKFKGLENVDIKNYHDNIDYSSHGFDDWWGGEWVRAGLCSHYTTGAGEIEGSQASLPDFKTGSKQGVSIPKFFAKKYADATHYPRDGYKVLDLTNDESEAGNYRVRDYLIYWLSGWVREFGIDGFRCDTAKHIEKEAWYQLKVACVDALREWKDKQKDKGKDVFEGDFWMTGEVNPHDVIKDEYFTDGGFNSLINFMFPEAIKNSLSSSTVNNVDTTYAKYDKAINSEPNFNMLTYISSHDTYLFYSDYANENQSSQMIAGSLLAFCPGAIQVYYGDECGRKKGMTSITREDYKDQYIRTQMPWPEDGYNTLDYQFNSDIYAHWSKVLNFRKNHVAVGAGTHAKIADTPYTFSRVKGDDKVVVVLGASGSTEVDVSSVFADGTSVKDYYSGATATVSGGKVTFTPTNGTILIELAE